MRRWASWFLPVFATGCISYPSVVRDRFEQEYGCSDVDVEEMSGNAFRASGCGVQATYVCVSDTRSPGTIAQTEDAVCIQESRPTVAGPATPPPGPRYAWPPGSGRVRERRDDFQRVTVVQMDMTVSEQVFRLVGAPAAIADVVMAEIEVPGGGERYRNCDEALLLADGTLHRLAAKTHESGAENLATTRFDLRLADLRVISGATEVKGRFCRRDWTFTPSQVETLRDFLDRYDRIAATEAPAADASASAPAPDAGVSATGTPPDAAP